MTSTISMLTQCTGEPKLTCVWEYQMELRAQPFKRYHNKICSDTITFFPPWMSVPPTDLNLNNEKDTEHLGYGVFLRSLCELGVCVLCVCGAL